MTDIYFRNNINPVGKIAEKTVCKSVTWHCILSAELTKNALFQTVFFWRFCPLGSWKVEILHAWYLYTYYNSDSILQYFELFYMCWMWL